MLIFCLNFTHTDNFKYYVKTHFLLHCKGKPLQLMYAFLSSILCWKTLINIHASNTWWKSDCIQRWCHTNDSDMEHCRIIGYNRSLYYALNALCKLWRHPYSLPLHTQNARFIVAGVGLGFEPTTYSFHCLPRMELLALSNSLWL